MNLTNDQRRDLEAACEALRAKGCTDVRFIQEDTAAGLEVRMECAKSGKQWEDSFCLPPHAETLLPHFVAELVKASTTLNV